MIIISAYCFYTKSRSDCWLLSLISYVCMPYLREKFAEESDLWHEVCQFTDESGGLGYSNILIALILGIPFALKPIA